MHAIHPHVPRPLVAALGALVLTVLVVLAIASSTGDVHVTLGDRASSDVTTSRPATVVQQTTPRGRPAWLSNPLASPINELAAPVPQR
jgi:hypothetical protein